MNMLATPLFVLVIVPDRLPGWAGIGLRVSMTNCFDVSSGPLGITRLLVGFQHVFHRCDEGGVGVGWNHPLPIAVRLESVFIRCRTVFLPMSPLAPVTRILLIRAVSQRNESQGIPESGLFMIHGLRRV